MGNCTYVAPVYTCLYGTKKENNTVSEFIASLNLVPPLNPRDSFFGGRTNATRLHYKVTGEEKIKYVDFTS